MTNFPATVNKRVQRLLWQVPAAIDGREIFITLTDIKSDCATFHDIRMWGPITFKTLQLELFQRSTKLRQVRGPVTGTMGTEYHVPRIH